MQAVSSCSNAALAVARACSIVGTPEVVSLHTPLTSLAPECVDNSPCSTAENLCASPKENSSCSFFFSLSSLSALSFSSRSPFLSFLRLKKKFPSYSPSFLSTGGGNHTGAMHLTLRSFSSISVPLHASRVKAVEDNVPTAAAVPSSRSISSSTRRKKAGKDVGRPVGEIMGLDKRKKKGKLTSSSPSPSSSKVVYRSGTSSPGILFSDDEDVVVGSAALLAKISAQLRPSPDTFEQNKKPIDEDNWSSRSAGENTSQCGVDSGRDRSGAFSPRSLLDVVHTVEENEEKKPHQKGDSSPPSSNSSSSPLPHLLAMDGEEDEPDEGALDLLSGSLPGSPGFAREESGMNPADPTSFSSTPNWCAPSSSSSLWNSSSTSVVPNLDEEGIGGDMNAFAAASLEQDEHDGNGGRRRRHHHPSFNNNNFLDNGNAGKSGHGSTDLLDISGRGKSDYGGGHPNVNESVLCAIDMLCDDLFSCKTDVLRSFARARHIFHGSKTVMVTRLIERAHADAHGENMDLSITRRLLGDVFEGAGHEVRVSGIRSVWTNRSLEASHIEAACARHFQFQALANSNKTLVVRRHGAETSRLTRKLCRPFQESLDKVSDLARSVLERIQDLKAQQPCFPPSSAMLPLLFLEAHTVDHPPSTTPPHQHHHNRSQGNSEMSTTTRKHKEGKDSKENDENDNRKNNTEEEQNYNFEEIQGEVKLLVSQLSTTEIIGPFAAFLISYIRYGASRNLLSRVDVIEKLMQMGVVQPTIEEEDLDVEAVKVDNNCFGKKDSTTPSGDDDPSLSYSDSNNGSRSIEQNGTNGSVKGKEGEAMNEEEEEIGFDLFSRLTRSTAASATNADRSLPEYRRPLHDEEEDGESDEREKDEKSHRRGSPSDSSSSFHDPDESTASPTIRTPPNNMRGRYGQDTLVKLCTLFEDVVRLVRKRQEQTKAPGATPAQRIAFDSPDFILLDVLDFIAKPTSHWKVAYSPSWVQDLARTFTNWEICVRTDLQTFSDAPSYVFDTILVGVVHYYIVERIYGRDGVSSSDVVLSVRGGLKKAMEKMADGNVERATGAAHELIAYVNASMETSRGFSGDFFIQVLSQMRGVADMHTMRNASLDLRSGRTRFAGLSSSKQLRHGSDLSSSGAFRDIDDKEFEEGEEEEDDEEGEDEEREEDMDDAELDLELSDSKREGNNEEPPGKSLMKNRKNQSPLSRSRTETQSVLNAEKEQTKSKKGMVKKKSKKGKGEKEVEVINPSRRYHKRVAMVLKEIGKVASRCTRAGNLLDILVRVTEDVYFHYRFARVFRNLNLQDKMTIRLRRATHLQKTLGYFEKVQGVTKPISLEAITYLVLLLTFFSMRPHGDSSPALLRYDSMLGLPELALVGLRERGITTIRELRVAFPPQLSYRSWLLESDTKEKSVYRVLPSVAVKGPTNEAMLVSQAPMMKALDAISKVPWRIHKFILHIQEAMVREGYGFGKLRPAFYPLHYTSLHPGTVYYKVKKDELEWKEHENSTKKKSDTEKKKKKEEEKKVRKNDEKLDEESQDNEEEIDSSEDLNSLQVTRRAGKDRDNESSIFDFDEVFGPTEDGEVVGCNIKQRMAFDFQQSVDWKALSDVRSSRTHYLQALRQARSIVQFSHLYFPNSMDFRGRMYPLPGRLNHTGSDPFRALLEYADPKPLGKVGLYWLKVHLANKMGMTKLSFDERVHYVEEHIPDVVQSAESPLSGDRWWQEASEPFQCLMACKELSDALKYSQGAEYFPSRLPVAVDGSYNGLQHYSAIGRDAFGAQLVNLVPSERPADAYTGILKEMMKVIEKEASMDHPVAQRCLGTGKGQDKNHIKRKTIKRPIMTQVYGVTGYGMSEQILEELGKQNKSHGLWTQADMKEMAIYLKDKVLDSLGITFRETQRCREWLREVATLVYSAQPNELRNALSWTTPLGLVVRQPYRVQRDDNLFTMQGLTRIPGDVIGAAGRKQLTAMAPNLIHSLDATHLALTALEMQREGLSMMAVHDSYWTYACDLPKLSSILRQQFVQLYTEHDPLWELKEQWEEAFFFDLRRHGIVLPDPPSRGDLDLKVVLDSPYFFS